MSRALEILAALSDGEFHSGDSIASKLGLTRAAVWKQVQTFQDYGLTPEAVRGKGYRLPFAIQLLTQNAILAELSRSSREAISQLDILFTTESTNAYLTEQARVAPIHGRLCLAEYQSAGRGRRGRQWVAPLGTGLCLSLGWRFDSRLEAFTALSLAVAVALFRALDRLGASEVGIKWPNDLLWRGRKLAGILIEVHGEITGAVDVIIGIGLNVEFPEQLAVRLEQPIDQPWADLMTVLNKPVSRNTVAGVVIDELVGLLVSFERGGFESVLREWHMVDLIRDQPITLKLPGEDISGVARGVAADGALLVEVEGQVERYFAGDVSVRPALGQR